MGGSYLGCLTDNEGGHLSPQASVMWILRAISISETRGLHLFPRREPHQLQQLHPDLEFILPVVVNAG